MNDFDGVEHYDQCKCGKMSFDKKTAQTKKNYLERKGRVRKLRIYRCPMSNLWHLTSK